MPDYYNRFFFKKKYFFCETGLRHFFQNSSFAGIVCLTLTLSLPDSAVDSLVGVLADLFGFPEDQLDFILNQLIPKVSNLVLQNVLGNEVE